MKYKIIILLSWLLIANSCKKENLCDCVKSTGPTNTIYRDIKGFNCIKLQDKINLYITQGPEFEVRVDAGRNLQGLIKTELDGETLKAVFLRYIIDDYKASIYIVFLHVTFS